MNKNKLTEDFNTNKNNLSNHIQNHQHILINELPGVGLFSTLKALSLDNNYNLITLNNLENINLIGIPIGHMNLEQIKNNNINTIDFVLQNNIKGIKEKADINLTNIVVIDSINILDKNIQNQYIQEIRNTYPDFKIIITVPKNGNSLEDVLSKEIINDFNLSPKFISSFSIQDIIELRNKPIAGGSNNTKPN